MRCARLLAQGDHITPASVSPTPEVRNKPVTFAGVAWAFGLGVGVAFLEGRSVTEPQLAVFRLGAIRVALNNVVPQNVLEKGTPKFLLMLYASVFVLCLHPIALLFRGTANFRDAFRLGFIFFGACYLLSAVFVVVATLLFVDVLRLGGFPVFSIIIRCFAGGKQW
jgi:hypothetical protein